MSIICTELAWAAGFFDGEGYIGCSQNKISCQLNLSIHQVHPEVLERFKNAVGVGGVNGPYKKDKTNRQDYYTYFARSRDSEVIFSLLKPYLSSVKTLQFENSFLKYEEYNTRSHCHNGHELTTENRYKFKGRNNGCRECRREIGHRSWKTKNSV